VEAAAGLAYLFGDGTTVAEVDELQILASTTTTVTIGWDPVPGAVGYRLSSETQGTKYAVTWDPNIRRSDKYPACNTVFHKSAWYKVEALLVGAELTLP